MSSTIIISPASPPTPTPTSSTSISKNKLRVPQTSACLRPPPNTPLSPTAPTFLLPFAPTLSTSHENPSSSDEEVNTINDKDDDEPHTLETYGELTPTETYHPPTPPTNSSPLGSPKRSAFGCLSLRSPVKKPPMPKRSYSNPSHSDSESSSSTSYVGYGGYGYGGHMIGGGGKNNWCRIVIGGDLTPTPSPTVTTSTPLPLPTTNKQSPNPNLLAPPCTPSLSSSTIPSPITPNSPAPIPIPLRCNTLRPLSLAQSAPSPHLFRSGMDEPTSPTSPAPLPIPIRPLSIRPFAWPRHISSKYDDPASDTETVVDPTDSSLGLIFDLDRDVDARASDHNSASDTCASDSESDEDSDEDDVMADKKVRTKLGSLKARTERKHKSMSKTKHRALVPKQRGLGGEDDTIQSRWSSIGV